MTISTEPVPLPYNGDGSTTAFPITWKYFAKSHVVATLRASGVETLWVLDTDYTLTAAGVEAGGTLTATTPPATGETLVISLDPPNNQDKSLPLGGAFPSTSVEDGLDIGAQRDGKLEALFNRCLRVPKTDTQSDDELELPIDSARASKFLAFDSNGKPIASVGTTSDFQPVSAFFDELIDDADASIFTATLNANFTGSNTALGSHALDSDTSGTNNSAFGINALTANISGVSNIAVGSSALAANTTNNNNVAIGINALGLSTANSNTAVGTNALDANTTGTLNVAVGADALGANTTASNNVGVGNNALDANTTGTSNVGVGNNALGANTTADNNTAVGFGALASNTTGTGNTAVGTQVLDVNTTGNNNVAIGINALGVNTTANDNTAVGASALDANTTGASNTAVGQDALTANTTGAQNTVLGNGTGSTITTGTNLTCLGQDAEPSSATATNEVTLGNTSVGTLRCQVALTVLSDERDKKDIKTLSLGADFINAIRPVKFTWARRDGTKEGVQEAGFIAQELDIVQKAFGAEDYLRLVYKANPDKLEATPANLIPVLVKAIQELSQRVRQLETR